LFDCGVVRYLLFGQQGAIDPSGIACLNQIAFDETMSGDPMSIDYRPIAAVQVDNNPSIPFDGKAAVERRDRKILFDQKICWGLPPDRDGGRRKRNRDPLSRPRIE
jgi:hypothetical protein